MGRIRAIKPEFFVDEDLVRLEPLDRLAFIGLWTVADKAGRMEDRPVRLAMQVLPFESAGFADRLDRLVDAKFLLRYEIDGRRYLAVRSWNRHQQPHHTERPSVLAGPEKGTPVPSPLSHGVATVAKPLRHRLATRWAVSYTHLTLPTKRIV